MGAGQPKEPSPSCVTAVRGDPHPSRHAWKSGLWPRAGSLCARPSGSECGSWRGRHWRTRCLPSAFRAGLGECSTCNGRTRPEVSRGTRHEASTARLQRTQASVTSYLRTGSHRQPRAGQRAPVADARGRHAPSQRAARSMRRRPNPPTQSTEMRSGRSPTSNDCPARSTQDHPSRGSSRCSRGGAQPPRPSRARVPHCRGSERKRRPRAERAVRTVIRARHRFTTLMRRPRLPNPRTTTSPVEPSVGGGSRPA